MSPCTYHFSKIAVKWRDLTWLRKSPKFLHHLQKISMGFKMAVLTPKSGIAIELSKQPKKHKKRTPKISNKLYYGRLGAVSSVLEQLTVVLLVPF